jgi:predicted phage tail protein
MTALIAGAGGMGGGKGGGGAARTPTTARDSLDSRQYAELIDLISEGEIQGLKDGFKSIFLDNTPLQNPDGTYNFQNVTVYTRNGTQNQDAIPFAGEIEDERGVGVTVRNDGPVTRTITDSQTDAVRITISVPRLERDNQLRRYGWAKASACKSRFNTTAAASAPSLMTRCQAARATHTKRHTS